MFKASDEFEIKATNESGETVTGPMSTDNASVDHVGQQKKKRVDTAEENLTSRQDRKNEEEAGSLKDMPGIESDIVKLLAGDIVDTGSIDLSCRPQSSAAPNVDEYKPVVKRTVCYIVMALVFDDEGRVILIQEAKASCRGLWYIPAGRVEPGENFIDGVKREVLEEAGFEIEPLTVSSIEAYGSQDWYRIGYVGRVTGGKLKTLEEQDSESLQAQWFTVDEILNGSVKLRHHDFFKSLKLAQKYISQPVTSRHPHYHIGTQPHQHLLLRPVVIKQTQGSMEVLCCRKTGRTRLPCCKLHPREFSLSTALNCVFRDVFQLSQSRIYLPVQGLLTVEHCGIPAREHDGICLTPVFVLPGDLHDKFENVPNKEYVWYKIANTSISEQLTHRTFTEDLLIPLLEKSGGSSK
ncbi:8-oxo-dGDP phosphatase NUDT18-like isoform X1 [Mercenaria mercenaria]|uniref:8-oxo-dGDP phosphatase NUDT18-like isoform X1 n=1 Tax=Mercenaria mercenaria TaxID=6596 RepID=UPI00234FAD15|nr:8-oxo-dGDP phosphatase NUDT18-like isoform X1 [Mercenaria mercenaria]